MASQCARLGHRRSSTWGGSGASPPHLDDAQRPNDNDESGDIGASSSSSSSQRKPTNRNRLIDRVKHGPGMKLDLDAVKDWRNSHDGRADGDAELRLRKERLATSEKECSCILPYLYLSGQAVAEDLSILQESRITHIINCVGFVCAECFPHVFSYRTLWLQDSPSEDIMCVLYDVFDLIEKVREQTGCRVLLHCCQGVSRSAAFAIAYLMWRKNESFEDALSEVKSKRDVVSPNMGFVGQLMQWRTTMLESPDRTTHKIYRIAPQSVYDPLYLVSKSVDSGCIEVLDSRGAFLICIANMLYVWRGKHCDKDMVAAAQHVGFQVARYEGAQGPCVLVREGSECTDIPQVWAQLLEKSEAHTDGMDGKHIFLYDSDFELYRNAKMGTYVAPAIGAGVVINLSPRHESRSQL